MTFSRRTSSLILIAFTTCMVGAVSVQASPTCQRLVRVYREKLVRNPVSKATAARWAEWNKGHPNFHPKPRPKYRMTPEETTRKVDFACQVPVDPAEVATDIPPLIPDFTMPPTADVVFPPPVLPNVVEVATAATPAPPFLPPYSPGVPPVLAAIPEPSSMLLTVTGVGLIVMQMYFIRRKARLTA